MFKCQKCSKFMIGWIWHQLCADWGLEERRLFLDQQHDYDGPKTRGRCAGDVLAPDQRSWAGKTTKTKASIAWNALPREVRAEEDADKARRMIKRFVKIWTIVFKLRSFRICCPWHYYSRCIPILNFTSWRWKPCATNRLIPFSA